MMIKLTRLIISASVFLVPSAEANAPARAVFTTPKPETIGVMFVPRAYIEAHGLPHPSGFAISPYAITFAY